jgi:hypothetical protein
MPQLALTPALLRLVRLLPLDLLAPAALFAAAATGAIEGRVFS